MPSPTKTESQQHRSDEKATPVARTKNEASIAPFNPTCDQAIESALELLKLKDNDVLFDLGCGDARMLLYSAEQTPGLKCVGIDLDPIFVNRGRDALGRLPASVQCRVDVREGDLLKIMEAYQNQQNQQEGGDGSKVDSGDINTNSNTIDDDSILEKECQYLSLFEDATAIFLFLLPKGIQKIQGLLNALAEKRKQEGRTLQVIAYMFSVREWEPVLVDRTTKGEAPLYLYQFGYGESGADGDGGDENGDKA